MKIKLTSLNNKFAFEATNDYGNKITFDANPSIGGENLGFRPMENLLASLASCASIDILLIMQKKRITLEHFEVSISGERSNEIPSPFKKIHLIFNIGINDPIDQVTRAVELSILKYCSVAATLSPDIILSWDVLKSH